jgi:hypothetical protein
MPMNKLLIWSATFLFTMFDLCAGTPAERYLRLQRNLASGWNTWDTYSVLNHVWLPHGLAVDLHVISADGERRDYFRIGERGRDVPLLHAGAHTYDGVYTEINVEWKGHKIRVRSAAEGKKNIILITPLEGNYAGGKIVVVPKAMWKRGSNIVVEGQDFTLASFNKSFRIDGFVHGKATGSNKKEITLSADEPVVVCCGENLSPEEAGKFVDSKGDAFAKANRERFGEEYDCYNAMQSVLAWDNIYDPTIDRVITPVSRIWNVDWGQGERIGGFVLFCWDTYFASMMISVGNKELAYANAVEITNAITESGFVPNFHADHHNKSRDRSQPPVGSLAVWRIYRQYGEKWFLELLYDKLLTWNRWWVKNREVNGLFCWGSNPYEHVTYRRWEYYINSRHPAVLECGLDNTQMFDDVQFDDKKHVLKLNDAGLSSLYIMDCEYLADIAGELGKADDVVELRERADYYRKNLSLLWDEKDAFYYNRSTENGSFNKRTSPTNFYPLLARTPSSEQARRMIETHLLNPDEYGGEWMIPSTSRNDPAFKDNTYWRGRIWAPLNYLVYEGLRNYDLPEARKELAEKSKALLMKSWLSRGYVFENYNAVSGVGDDVGNSDKFYHWGALLGYISLIENGRIDNK